MTKLSGFWYVVAAYSLIWIVLLVYVISLGSRLNKIRKEIELLQEVVQKKSK